MSLLSIRWRKPTEIRDSVIRTLRPAVVTGFTDAPGSTQSATSADWIVDSRSSNKATVVASVVTTDSGDSHSGAIGRTGCRRDRTVAPPPNGLSSNFGALFLDHLSMVEATSVAQSARTIRPTAPFGRLGRATVPAHRIIYATVTLATVLACTRCPRRRGDD